MSRWANLTMRPVKGRAMATLSTLYTVWNMASCTCGMLGNIASNGVPSPRAPPDTMPRTNASAKKMIAPPMLSVRLMTGARLALVLPAMPARSDTMHAPMLEPMVMKMPWSKVMRPAMIMVMATDVMTEELSMMAVRTAPMTTRRTGLLMLARKSRTGW